MGLKTLRMQFDFSIASLRTHRIRGGCHKDITDIKDEFRDEKYDK